MRAKKIVSLFLAAALLSVCFASCSKSGSEETRETTEESTEYPAPTYTTTAETAYTFVFAGAAGLNPEYHLGTAYEEELNRIYDEVCGVCGVKIVFSDLPLDVDTLIASAFSGTKHSDIVKVRQSTWIPLAVKGYLYPLDTEEMLEAGLDVYDSDCFFQPYTALGILEIGGEEHCWAADISGKYDRLPFGHTYAFNKNLLTNMGYTEEFMFGLVYEKEWTYGKMIEIAAEMTQDVDSDGQVDIWGIALDCDGNEIWSNGTGPIIHNPVTGLWEPKCSDPRVIISLQFMAQLNSDGMLSPSLLGEAALGRGSRRGLFYTGAAAFAGLYGRNYGYEGVDTGTANMSDGVGLLPIPRGPDTDKYTLNYMDVDNFCMLISAQNSVKAAKTFNEIGRRVHDDGEFYDYILHEALLDCEDSFKVLTQYLMPYGTMNIAKCSDAMYDLTRRQFVKSVYEGSMSPTQAAETFDPLIGAELDRVFNQK